MKHFHLPNLFPPPLFSDHRRRPTRIPSAKTKPKQQKPTSKTSSNLTKYHNSTQTSQSLHHLIQNPFFRVPFSLYAQLKFLRWLLLNLFLELLVSVNWYNEVISVFFSAVNSGIMVDKFSYGKVIQSAVKLGDLKKGFELKDLMERRK
ncbi:hypothetical protein Leryth_023875 [Lithospermum erythrorhizon]|nr:hypothetical protein Leryth_023875 [Lithospermum erythrorhizon]